MQVNSKKSFFSIRSDSARKASRGLRMQCALSQRSRSAAANTEYCIYWRRSTHTRDQWFRVRVRSASQHLPLNMPLNWLNTHTQLPFWSKEIFACLLVARNLFLCLFLLWSSGVIVTATGIISFDKYAELVSLQQQPHIYNSVKGHW